MEKGYLTVSELSKKYKISGTAVRKWLDNGLKYEIEKVIGVKPRKIVKIKDVENYLNLGVRRK